MVVFGPILTDEDSYGLAVVETDDEQALREFAAQDPVVTTGTAAFEFGRMAAGTRSRALSASCECPGLGRDSGSGSSFVAMTGWCWSAGGMRNRARRSRFREGSRRRARRSSSARSGSCAEETGLVLDVAGAGTFRVCADWRR